jgi:hypothetical protein
LAILVAGGMYQMGDDQARSWSVAGTPSEIGRPLHARGADGFHVALQQRLERLLGFPFGVLRRELLHAIKCEKNLCIHGIAHGSLKKTGRERVAADEIPMVYPSDDSPSVFKTSNK